MCDCVSYLNFYTGEDFTLGAVVPMIFRLQPDEQIVLVSFTPLEDDFLENLETVSLQLTRADNIPGVSISPDSTIVRILDNEGIYTQIRS